MAWTLILVLIAFGIYLFYNAGILGFMGVPKSLSETFYLLKAKKEWLRIFFPIMMMLMAWLLLPAWLELSQGHNLQFMAFFAAAGIMFTGAAPAFKKHNLENWVHTASAIWAAVFALLWVIFVSKLWWLILIWLGLVVIAAFASKTWKLAYVYWLETVAFLSTFTAIILHHLI